MKNLQFIHVVFVFSIVTFLSQSIAQASMRVLELSASTKTLKLNGTIYFKDDRDNTLLIKELKGEEFEWLIIPKDATSFQFTTPQGGDWIELSSAKGKFEVDSKSNHYYLSIRATDNGKKLPVINDKYLEENKAAFRILKSSEQSGWCFVGLWDQFDKEWVTMYWIHSSSKKDLNYSPLKSHSAIKQLSLINDFPLKIRDKLQPDYQSLGVLRPGRPHRFEEIKLIKKGEKYYVYAKISK